MDSVLWFIYFAGVAETLKITAGITLLVGTIFLIFMNAAHMEEYGEMSPHSKRGIGIGFLCVLLIIFTPSANLLYSIAGLKAGEVALQTEEGQKAMKILNKKLDELLKEE